jgi:hypothetical protein
MTNRSSLDRKIHITKTTQKALIREIRAMTKGSQSNKILNARIIAPKEAEVR